MLKPRFLFALGVTLLAGVLYFPPPSKPYWFDEVYTAHMSTFRHPLLGYLKGAYEDPHPPLYYLLARAWAEVLGGMDPGGKEPPGNEGLMRGLSSLTGVVSVAYLAFRVHPVAGLLLLGSPAWATKVAEARMYPLLGLLALMAYVELRRSVLLSSFLGLLALYTQYLALFFAGWFALFALAARRVRETWPYLLYLPWVPVILAVGAGGTNAHLRPNPISNTAALGELAGYPMGLALLFLVAYAALVAARRGQVREAFWLLIPTLTVLSWWVSGYWVNTASPRYWGAFLPPLAASVGVALGWVRWRRVFLVLLTASGLAGLAWWQAEGGIRVYVADEGYQVSRTLLEAMVRKQGEVTVLVNETGRAMALRYYIRDERIRIEIPGSGYREAPWEGKYAAFFIFYPSIGLENAPNLWELAWHLKEKGCRVRFQFFGSSALALTHCPGRVGDTRRFFP